MDPREEEKLGHLIRELIGVSYRMQKIVDLFAQVASDVQAAMKDLNIYLEKDDGPTD